MYLHLWGSFGLSTLVLFTLFNLFLVVKIKSRKMLIILLSFFLIGLTTNYMYLWPLGYLYWGFLSFCFTPHHSVSIERLVLDQVSLHKGSTGRNS